MYTDGHGGILVAASAAMNEEEAVNKALLEMNRFLFYHPAIKKTSIFKDYTDVELLDIKTRSRTVFHQAYYLRTTIPLAETNFLHQDAGSRNLINSECDIHNLMSVVSIKDLATYVENNKWKVIKAYSDKLILMEFGDLSDLSEEYYARLKRVLGENSIRNRQIHPFG